MTYSKHDDAPWAHRTAPGYHGGPDYLGEIRGTYDTLAQARRAEWDEVVVVELRDADYDGGWYSMEGYTGDLESEDDREERQACEAEEAHRRAWARMTQRQRNAALSSAGRY